MHRVHRTRRTSGVPLALVGLAVAMPLSLSVEAVALMSDPAAAQPVASPAPSWGHSLTQAARQWCGVHVAATPWTQSVVLIHDDPAQVTMTLPVDRVPPQDSGHVVRMSDLPPPAC